MCSAEKTSRAWFPDYDTGKKEEFPGLVSIRGKTQGSHQGKRGHSVTLVCACTYTRKCIHMCVCSIPFPPLTCPCPGGAGELAQHPLQGTALERSDTAFLHSTDCMQHSFQKKNIICLLARSVTKIIFTSMTLTVSGQEAERLCRPHCFPAPLGRPPENSTAVSEKRVRSLLGLQLMPLAIPLANCWEGERHARETCLLQPYTCDTDVHRKTTSVLNLGREYYFFL